MVYFNEKNDLLDQFLDLIFKGGSSEKQEDREEDGNFFCSVNSTENGYCAWFELPGVKKETINISFENDVLNVSVKKNESEKIGRCYYGTKKIKLYNADPDTIKASLKDGILVIFIDNLKNKSNKSNITIE